MADDESTESTESTEATGDADEATPGEPEVGEEVTETTAADVQPMAAAPNPVRDRLWLPLVLPLAAMAAIAVFVLNVSRVLLASGNGAGSVVVGTIVTVVILIGAAVISASPRLRTSTLTMTLSALMVVVVGAGLVTLGPSEDHEGGEEVGFVEPEGDPTSTLEVDALPQLRFQSDEFTVPGGILGIDYVGRGGTHTLLFEDPQYQGFRLEVAGEETDSGKVEIAEGEYVIFCDVPGHRAAGMEATVTITPPPPGAEVPGGGEPPAGGEGEPGPEAPSG